MTINKYSFTIITYARLHAYCHKQVVENNTSDSDQQ